MSILRLLRRRLVGAAARTLIEAAGLAALVVATWGVDWRAGLATLGVGLIAEANFGEVAR